MASGSASSRGWVLVAVGCISLRKLAMLQFIVPGDVELSAYDEYGPFHGRINENGSAVQTCEAL